MPSSSSGGGGFPRPVIQVLGHLCRGKVFIDRLVLRTDLRCPSRHPKVYYCLFTLPFCSRRATSTSSTPSNFALERVHRSHQPLLLHFFHLLRCIVYLPHFFLILQKTLSVIYSTEGSSLEDISSSLHFLLKPPPGHTKNTTPADKAVISLK